MSSLRRQRFITVTLVLLATVCHISDADNATFNASPETSDNVTDVRWTSTNSLLTSSVTVTTGRLKPSGHRENPMTTPVNAYNVASKTTTRSAVSTDELGLSRGVKSTTDMITTSQSLTGEKINTLSFGSDNRTSLFYQTSPLTSASTATSDGSKFSADYSPSPNRTAFPEMQATVSHRPPISEATNTRVSIVTNRTAPTATLGVTVTSFPLYTGNVTAATTARSGGLTKQQQVANMTSDMTVMLETVTPVSGNATRTPIIFRPITTSDRRSSSVDEKTLPLAIGLGVGLGLIVILLIVVIVIVTYFAHRRKQRRRSDRRKLESSGGKYDRVILPSHITSSQQAQQPSGGAKIRRHRGNRLPSSRDVFALQVQSPTSTDGSSSRPLNGSVDQTSPGVLASPAVPILTSDNEACGARNKRPTKKDDKAARRLRGRPPELQQPYFIADGVTSPGPSEKTPSNDPFWDASEARTSTPRRPSIVDTEPTSLFKPSGSGDNLSTSGGQMAAGSTSNVPTSYVILPTGDIGASGTDNDA